MAHSPPPVDLCGYEPPISLWSVVEKYVKPHEREEVKNMLGASLVEQSLELHDEINLLLDIWREYREETLEQAQKRPQSLPEPPAARDRLKQEICFFVENLRERAQREGRDPDSTLKNHNTKVIDYAFKRPGSTGFSRPSTAMSSRDGRETPMTRRGTPNSDGMSLGSSLSEEVDSMQDKLNYLKMEEVVQHLRETIEEEVNQLLGDIGFLQGCLDDEATFRTESSMGTEPTLTDLREERSKLEKEMFTTDPLLSSPNTQSIRRTSGGLVPSSAGKMRPLQHQTSPGTQNSPSRSAPLKASHDIASQELLESAARKTRETNSATIARLPTRSGCKVQSHGSLTDSPSRADIEAMSPTHITIKTGKGPVPKSANLVRVGSIPAVGLRQNGDVEGLAIKHAPSPPSSAKSQTRPNSVHRFRNMVLNCRDTP